MRFIDAALADPMGAYLLLWMWRMIYVTQNNKIFPNIIRTFPIYLIWSLYKHLVGSAEPQTLSRTLLIPNAQVVCNNLSSCFTFFLVAAVSYTGDCAPAHGLVP